MDREPQTHDTARWDWDRTTFRLQAPFVWNPERLGFFRLRRQERGFSGIKGAQIVRAAIKLRVPLANINLFDFLKEYPEETPKWVKDGWYLYFVIPQYVERKGGSFARYLHWNSRTNSLEEGDTLITGYGFTPRCVLATYEGLRSIQ